ncbi:CpaF family protein [Stomatohabitans albus]|uniref:CpaF family protein n=1 Tax=Stomatohabitans albus TaxID=3110766 RepID=UPI00300CE2AA
MVASQPALQERIRRRLTALDIDVRDFGNPGQARAHIARALHEEGVIAAPDRMAELVRDLTDDLLGLGALEQLLREPGVTDVMVNGPHEVWVERDGSMERTSLTFADQDALLRAIRRVIGPSGHRLDTAQPWVDARLADGSRLHAVIAPIAIDGPLITLRRFNAATLSLNDLRMLGAVPEAVYTLLTEAVAARQSIVVCGRTGSGKTTLLQALLGSVDATQRIVLIEDSPEIRAEMPHMVRMQTRRISAEGSGEVTIAGLVRQSLRMRPDRIIVGEVRGVEIVDVLQALITGHEGCMTTVHAASSHQALVRLEGMALLAGVPEQAVCAQLASALDLIVVCARSPQGKRGVVEIGQVVGGQPGMHPHIEPLWERAAW